MKYLSMSFFVTMNGHNNSQKRQLHSGKISSIKQFRIRACAHNAYLLFGVRALGAETRNMVLHRKYFKYF